MFGLGSGLFFFIVLFVVAGLYLMTRRLANRAQLPVETIGVTTQVEASPLPPTALPSSIPPTSAPVETETPAVVAAPPQPSPTYPTYYVKINSITLSGNQFVVQYETFGYTEKLPWMHVHFFFNTVPADQAGMPGSGPWILYGGPRPFKGYTVTQRPQGATQMCALVANANHTVIPESGNCMDLPIP
jgi:hypothetical protein